MSVINKINDMKNDSGNESSQLKEAEKSGMSALKSAMKKNKAVKAIIHAIKAAVIPILSKMLLMFIIGLSVLIFFVTLFSSSSEDKQSEEEIQEKMRIYRENEKSLLATDEEVIHCQEIYNSGPKQSVVIQAYNKIKAKFDDFDFGEYKNDNPDLKTFNGSDPFISEGEWSAMFVSYVYCEAGVIPNILNHPFIECTEYSIIKEKQPNKCKYPSEYTPNSGDIIFFDLDQDGTPDHTGIVFIVDSNKIYTIEGNVGAEALALEEDEKNPYYKRSCVGVRVYDIDYSGIVGYFSFNSN